MADLREDFVNYVVKALVDNPEAVSITRKTDEKGDYLELQVDPSDMGKVIGKAGATAKSIRTLLRVVGAKDDLAPLPLKIIEPDGGRAVEVPVEENEPVSAPEEAQDEHSELHERTKKELKELDLDI